MEMSVTNFCSVSELNSTEERQSMPIQTSIISMLFLLSGNFFIPRGNLFIFIHLGRLLHQVLCTLMLDKGEEIISLS